MFQAKGFEWIEEGCVVLTKAVERSDKGIEKRLP
jgi:hypothetical protein